jgi:beta-galactosidase
MGGVPFLWRAWADLLRPNPEATSLATYTDQFYAGASAAVTRRLGKGTVTYIGVETLDGILERGLVRQVYERARVPIEDLPRGVYVEWRDGFFVGVNYSASPVSLVTGKGSRILVGTNPLDPARGLVWKDKGQP